MREIDYRDEIIPLIAQRDWEKINFIAPSEIGIIPFKPIKQLNGFVVGGENPTALIRGLDSLGSQTIEELEARMRPGKDSRVDFLGEDESLLAVLAADNEYIDSQGLSHQEIGRGVRMFTRLLNLGFQGIKDFTLNQKRFHLEGLMSMGVQESPFEDGTAEGADMIIINVDAKTGLYISCLQGHLIERYGFYEGKGTKYRAEPKDILAVFDYLKNR